MHGARCMLVALALLCVQAHARDVPPVRLAPPGIQPAFDIIDSRNGLPDSRVLEVVADRHGFLWISGDRGVQRFDGHTFFRLDRDPDRPDTLESRFIYSLADCGDALWIGNPNGNVQRLDYATGKLTLPPMQHDGASPQGILWVACDGLGQLWQMSDLGLMRLDRNGKLTRILPRSFDGMTFDPQGARMFLATSDRRVVSIDVRDPARMSTVLTLPPEIQEPVTAMASDAAGLWLAIDRDLWHFDFARQRLQRIAMPIPMIRTTFITQSADGALWLASWFDEGLYRFDPRAGVLSAYPHDPGDPQSLPSGSTSGMALDRNNNLWITKGETGLARLRLGQTALTRYRPAEGSTVCAMSETTEGRLMVSVCRGAPMELDRPLGQLKPLPGSSALPREGRVMIADRDGGLWLPSQTEGLFHWKPDGSVQRFPLPTTQGRHHVAMTGAYLDDQDRLWVSHHLGLAVLAPGTHALRNVEAFEGTRRFTFDLVQDVAPGPDGTLWLATMKGLLRYDPATRQVRRFQHDRADRRTLSDNYVIQTYTDREGRQWIATRAGLNRLVRDERGGVAFRRYGVSEGLPDITIEAVVGDAQGRLWVATTRGIARWDPAQDRFQSYLPSDGIPDSNVNLKSVLASRDGGLYFGTLDGLIRIDPRTLRIAEPAPIVLSGYETGNRSVVNLKGTQLSGIDTKYAEGRLVLNLAILGDARRLTYRMEGLDDRWQPMPESLSIVYHHLPPGSYRLQVRQLQSNGTWGPPDLALPIAVAAPWWRTAWAYALYALAAFAALVALARGFLAWRHRELRAQLKESNTRLSVALHAARFGMWAWDVAAQKAEVDAVTRELLALPAGPPVMDDLFARMHPDDAQRLRVQGDDALRTEGAVDYEFRLGTGEPQSWRWVEGHAARIRRHGKSAYLIGVNRDATQRKRELLELAESKQAAERAVDEARLANEAKGRFLAMMSHEIRTPISGVIGMVELLIDSPMSEDQRRQLGICRDSANLLLTIINDILDFSKIEAGKLTLVEAPLSPRRLVESVAESMAPLALHKGIALDVFVAPDVPRRLVGDRARLGQVLTNLLGNALKFTEAGSVRIEVTSTGPVAPGRHRIRFDVVDTGIGMDTRALEHLFEPFHQADHGTTRRFGGTGLGLTIVRHLVTLMEGSVECESTQGSGSRFTVFVPLTAIDADPREDAGLEAVRVLALCASSERTTLLCELARDLSIDIECIASPDALVRRLSTAQGGASSPEVVLIDQDFADSQDAFFNDTGGRPVLVVTRGGVSRSRAVRQGWTPLNASPLTSAGLARGIRIALGLPVASMATAMDVSVPAPRRSARAAEPVILVADDNGMNREVLSGQLMRLGHACDMAEDGERAWEMWQAHPDRYRLLLTDCHMPRLDGYGLTERIRREEAASGRGRLHIVAVTANALQGEGERCLAHGMDDFLTKPIPLRTLERMLGRVLPDLVASRALANLVGDNDASLHRLLDLYMRETDADLSKWKQACRSHDRALLQQLAHKLKSSCRLVGEDAATASLEAVEDHSGSAADLIALATGAQAELEQSLARVDAFRKHLRPC